MLIVICSVTRSSTYPFIRMANHLENMEIREKSGGY